MRDWNWKIKQLVRKFPSFGSEREERDEFHSTKNSGLNFQKFSWANFTEFSGVENDKSHSSVRLEFSMTSRSKQNTDKST